MLRRSTAPQDVYLEAFNALQKARRLREKGNVRKMLLVLAHACAMHEDDARLWSLYGALLAQHGRVEEGRAALRRALYLRHRQRDDLRERSTRTMLERLEAA